jgi:hypothetical protein
LKSFARVAELVDALDSKSSIRKDVRVRFPPLVQIKERTPGPLLFFKRLPKW